MFLAKLMSLYFLATIQKQPSSPLVTVVPPSNQSSTPIAFIHAKEPEEEEEEEAAAGHDSPNWGKGKSYTVLFGCTLLYSIIAEVLVQTVDQVMEKIAIDEKFLGLTLFALVPNITEFMNAISFALYGNIVLRYISRKVKWFISSNLVLYIVWKLDLLMLCKCVYCRFLLW